MAAVGAEHLGAERLGGQAAVEKVRAFFGLPLPEEHRERLALYLKECEAAAPAFRWAGPQNLHITVRFVGSIEREVAEGIASRVSGPAIRIALGDAGTFGRGRLARVVRIGLREGADELRALAGRVEAECQAAGLEAENRPFAPHLTLARAKPREGAALPELPPPPRLDAWVATELVLYSSHLGKGGAVHEPIRSIPLRD